MFQKMVYAGSNLGSYAMAEDSLRELAESSISLQRIRRAVEQAGEARVSERDADVVAYEARPIPEKRRGSLAVDPPKLGVISVDGGRYQRRDAFGDKTRRRKHWREDKVGCLLSMTSETHATDPTPELPAWLLDSLAVAQIAKLAEASEQAARSESDADFDSSALDALDDAAYDPPELVSREVLATGCDWEMFGRQLAARAWRRGFPAAERLAFVADGAHVNWTLQRKHFGRATAILDLIHALSYAYSAAKSLDELSAYESWAKQIWRGEVELVIHALHDRQKQIGKPPDDAKAGDPRERVDRALTYYQNHRSRMNYPEYRRQGLPLTSSHIESTIKQINRRVKGTEKFWSEPLSEAVLQLRADYLSDSQPIAAFWLRRQASQTGANAYKKRR